MQNAKAWKGRAWKGRGNAKFKMQNAKAGDGLVHCPVNSMYSGKRCKRIFILPRAAARGRTDGENGWTMR